jgi:hypothetical protein
MHVEHYKCETSKCAASKPLNPILPEQREDCDRHSLPAEEEREQEEREQPANQPVICAATEKSNRHPNKRHPPNKEAIRNLMPLPKPPHLSGAICKQARSVATAPQDDIDAPVQALMADYASASAWTEFVK